MKNSTKKFLDICKWLSLAFCICFSLVSCAESLLPSQKTVDQVGGLMDDDFINTADYVALKDFDVAIEKPNKDNVYYIGQKIKYEASYTPLKASYKTLKYEINDESLISIDEHTREIECLKTGHVEINFQVLKEEKVGVKTLSFDIKKLEFKKFNIIDNAGNIINNKDIIFKNTLEAPKLYKIDTDSLIARDLLLNIEVGDKKIANVTKDGENLKVTPISEGRTTAKLKINDLEIHLYISTIEINLTNVRLNNKGVLKIDHGLDFIFNTLYFNCDDVRAVDHERLIVDFEEDSYFELADYRSGYIEGRNQFFLNIRYKESKYEEVAAMPVGTKIIEKIKVRYVYPGGTEVVLNQDRLGNKHDYFTIEATTIQKLTEDNYSFIPSEINFGYLVNEKGEFYHQDYFQDLVTKTPSDDDKIRRVDVNFPKFEVIKGNSNDLNLAKSTYYRLVISLNEGVIPASEYVIRFYFNKFDTSKYKDITVHFETINSLKNVDKMYVDFRNLYGELDKTKNNVIPSNITTTAVLKERQLAHYEFVNKDREVIPAFKAAGIIIDEDCINKDYYNIYRDFTNISKTGEEVAHKRSFYDANYCYNIGLQNKLKLLKDEMIIRFTSPVYDFFNEERVWSEFKIKVDDSPVHIKYKVNNKEVQVLDSNKEGLIYEYPEVLSVGDSLSLVVAGTFLENELEEATDFSYYGYAFSESTNYDGVLYQNIKNRDEACARMPSHLGSIFPISYEASDPDVANFSNTKINIKYPGETILTFNNGFDYGDHYEYEFKIKLKVKGERNPIDVHKSRLLNLKEHEYSKNNLNEGQIRVGSSIKLDASMFDSNLFKENANIEVSNPSILHYNNETDSYDALRTGKVSIYVRLKEYNHVTQTFDLTVTNTTAPFTLLKSDFIKLNETNGVQSLVGHVNKEYNIRINPIINSTSKYVKVEEVNSKPILEINEAGVIKTLSGGNTKIKVTYGDSTHGEQPFEKVFDLEVIDNSEHYEGVIYFTRKFIGHFTLNAAITVCSTVFLILLFYNKKKLNYVILPATLVYGGFMACLSEFIQGFVPTRYCDLGDMWINFQGSLCGIILTLLIYGIVILSIYLYRKKHTKSIEK